MPSRPLLAAPSGVGHPRSLGYDDRISAERGVELAKADNERQVAATKRSRKFKTHPATYTIVELN